MSVAAKTKARTPPRGASYEADFYSWTQEQAARLRAGAHAALDAENLAEEIESLGRSEFNSLVGAWRVVLLHMLKVDHQPERRSRSWAISIAAQRANAGYVLQDNPGLKRRLDEAFARAYHGARLEAARETGLPLSAFPETCPYTREAMLTRPFDIDPDSVTP
ncbi:DUF29 domain-containing protein [Methylobacterium durans]|uniref:DUF29 domain-containing protein n=1 Tax=Methylobacterium durans TaxID=2202825 RepID=A0A2U8VZT0_9HYPH|nr:DUF29 domain-containing protein [Methylobacterium durans]AWN39323.1 DUF29 domain-containing protein [Methylobacterium durans]